ncbi:uncharacterized protein BJ171DRAFT_514635 [Polychytrium aggregatum]|uniref:uncharacterized protein n=1 Tax=Polychytrium aggregatum TaxID=110093 RepID=UPI0022FECAF9|nr:uncharacterized protein BJ171DRAFT_514635 [Polychytrium aggregatum]KAI9202274.1 hypothetical protein BJ171DRAFT_514635 [Polychytrium aggregatum]
MAQSPHWAGMNSESVRSTVRGEYQSTQRCLRRPNALLDVDTLEAIERANLGRGALCTRFRCGGRRFVLQTIWSATISSISLFIFIRNRNDARIGSRAITLTVFSSCCGFISAQGILIMIAFENVSCHITTWMILLGTSGYLSSIFYRFLRLISMAHIAELQMPSAARLHDLEALRPSIGRTSSTLNQRATAILAYIRSNSLALKNYSGLAFIIGAVLLTVGAQLWLSFSAAALGSPDTVCVEDHSTYMLPFVCFCLLYVFVLFPIVIWKIHALKIVHPIRVEILRAAVTAMVCTPLFAVWQRAVMNNFPQVGYYFRAFMWLVIQWVVIHFVTVVLPLIPVLRKRKLSEYSLENVTFERCLSDPYLFKEMCVISNEVFCVENTSFIAAIKKLRARNARAYEESEYIRPEDHVQFNDIYQRFIRNDAPFELNLSADHRMQLKDLFETTGTTKRIPYNCFENAKRETEILLYQGVYPLLIERLKSTQSSPT